MITNAIHDRDFLFTKREMINPSLIFTRSICTCSNVPSVNTNLLDRYPGPTVW